MILLWLKQFWVIDLTLPRNVERELFDKYLKEPKIMMKLFEEAIIKDFYEERDNLLEDEAYCISEFGAEITEKIQMAETN